MIHKRSVLVGIVFIVIGMAGCANHIEEPWVPDASYLESERNRTAELDQTLDHRVHNQQDR